MNGREKRNTATTRMSFLWVISAISILVELEPLAADMGSVWVESVSRTSITIRWSEPGGRHRIGSTVPTYYVVWEKDRPAGYPYNLGREEQTVNVEPVYTIEGLEPGTSYRVRVEAWAEKSVSREWVNAKRRLVGVVTQSTRSDDGVGHLRVVSTADSEIELEFTNERPEDFDVIRFAYKEKGSEVALNQTASAPLDPTWANDGVRGWRDFLSAESFRVTFSSLERATHYELVAYGLNTGPFPGNRVGRATASTGGARILTTTAANVACDHEIILHLYGADVTNEGQTTVFDLVSRAHPELLDTRDLLFADEGTVLDDDFSMLTYLIQKRPDVFALWQASELEDDARTLEAYMEAQHRATLIDIGLELDSSPQDFQRGDANVDGTINISDCVRTLDVLYLGKGDFSCRDAADVNDSGAVDLSDAVSLLNFLFGTGPRPAEPFGVCGQDPTDDSVDCAEYWACR